MSDMELFFDKILNSVVGTMLVIPCSDEKNFKSKKTLAYRQRLLIAKKFPGKDAEIDISKTEKDGQIFLVLTRKKPSTFEAILINPDGSKALLHTYVED